MGISLAFGVNKMANNLHRNLEVNEVVIVKLKPGYDYDIIDTRFVCKSGFGMSNHTEGRKIFGVWVVDGTETFIGYGAIEVERTNAYQAKYGKHGENDPDYVKE
jgi:hypothetical protein